MRKHFLWAGIWLLVLFTGWTILILNVDIQGIGPLGTEVGLASLNGWFHRVVGVHLWFYTVTDWLSLIPVFVCLMFGLVGLVQLISRKSLVKVDMDILYLGAYYVLVMLLYLVFEAFPVNYRPILIGDRPEASYPSSTVLLVCSVMPTLVVQARRRLKHSKAKAALFTLTVLFSAFMVAGRTLSGVHWLTDIVGAVLLSLGLFCVFCAAMV